MAVLRIFISHASADAAFAGRLANDLRPTGAQVWLDATHIGPGPFPQRISQAIDTSDVLVLVLTQDAINSPWVQQEMSAAIVRYNQDLMRSPAVVLAKPVPPRNIPSFWTIYNRIDATASYEQALPEIARALGVTLPKPPPQPLLTPIPQPATLTQTLSTTSPRRATLAPPTPVAPVPVDTAPKLPVQSASQAPAPPEVPPALQPKPASGARVISRRAMLIGAGALVAATAGIGGVTWFVRTVDTYKPGTLRWRNQVSANSIISGFNSFAAGNGMVFIAMLVGGIPTIYALDAMSGSQRWNYPTHGSRVPGLAVANGMAYAAVATTVDVELDTIIYALDAAMGVQRWSYQVGAWAEPTPAIANGVVYVGSVDGSIHALDATAGAQRWGYSTSSSSTTAGIASLAVMSGLVYAGSDTVYVYALNA